MIWNESFKKRIEGKLDKIMGLLEPEVEVMVATEQEIKRGDIIDLCIKFFEGESSLPFSYEVLMYTPGSVILDVYKATNVEAIRRTLKKIGGSIKSKKIMNAPNSVYRVWVESNTITKALNIGRNRK